MASAADRLFVDDLVTENDALRRQVHDLFADAFTLREVLAMSLERIHALTQRCNDQTNQIRRLMGLIDDGPRQVRVEPWSLTPEHAAATDIRSMVKEDEIRWSWE
jgi:hypothetical protein